MVVTNLVRGAAAAMAAVVMVGLGAVSATAAGSNGAPILVGADGVTSVTGGTLGTWPGNFLEGVSDGTTFALVAPTSFVCDTGERPYFFLSTPGQELANANTYINYIRGATNKVWTGLEIKTTTDWAHFAWSVAPSAAPGFVSFVDGTTAGTYSVGFACGVGYVINATKGAWYSTLTTDGAGNWAITAAVAPEVAPTAPTGVTVTPGVDSLAVAWGAVVATPAVTGYEVSVTDSNGAAVTATDASGATVTSPFSVPATTTSAAFSGLAAANGPYSVTVAAVSTVGTGAASDPVSGTPAAPAAPAATGTISAEVTIQSAVQALTMAVPSSGKATLGEATELADGSFVTTGTLGDITVTDSRAVADQTPWTVQATVSDFVGAATQTTFPQAQLGTKPTVTGTGITKGADAAPGSGGAVRVLATATNGSDGTINAGLDLVVPAKTADDTYKSTITIDLVKS